METISPITINIENSTNATAFNEKEMIHHDEFIKIKAEIDKRLNQLEDKSRINEYALDTITIYGSRGSGKTSFIKSLAEYYKHESSTQKDIEVIKIIDPTMIEEKGHIFLTIISQIKHQVDNKLNDCKCNQNDDSFIFNKKKWQAQFIKLSAGLPSINGSKPSMTEWQDPEYIMEKGIQSVESAMNLAENFHNLVENALKILNKKMFILFLDDVDIDFIKGWPLLETIRKYLTTPLITTIISGDLRLFSIAIRKQQWSNFGKAILINEGEK